MIILDKETIYVFPTEGLIRKGETYLNEHNASFGIFDEPTTGLPCAASIAMTGARMSTMCADLEEHIENGILTMDTLDGLAYSVVFLGVPKDANLPIYRCINSPKTGKVSRFASEEIVTIGSVAEENMMAGALTYLDYDVPAMIKKFRTVLAGMSVPGFVYKIKVTKGVRKIKFVKKI